MDFSLFDQAITLAQAAIETAPLPAADVPVEAAPLEGTTAGTFGAAPDFSVQEMFLRADPIVQATMVMLILASFWSWAIIFEKWLAYGRLRRLARRFEEKFWSGRPLEDLYADIVERPRSPIERVFVAGMTEWRRSLDRAGQVLPGTQARIDRAMTVAIAREGAQIGRRVPFLATVGSVSPFIGLFGTIWGIKTSFEAIAVQQNTNLAVVAPGIAEALLSTAIGLIAAIPAVMAFNRLSADGERLTATLENFADEFLTILARQIDRQSAGAA